MWCATNLLLLSSSNIAKHTRITRKLPLPMVQPGSAWSYTTFVSPPNPHQQARPSHQMRRILLLQCGSNVCYVLVRNDPWNYTYHSSDLLLTAPRRASFLAQSVYGLSSRSRLKIILRRINRG